MNYLTDIDPIGQDMTADYTCNECDEPITAEGYCGECQTYLDYEKRKRTILNKVSQLRNFMETTENVYSANKLKEIEKEIRNLYY